ncbi:MAG: PepSY domain-containing protein [Burkholderiaceae bacterium]|jgi:sulfite reductase (NADPH) flavoprotein alpha-component|nr:PepSY domain-containing protein [Burkholderiaceae bacterium]
MTWRALHRWLGLVAGAVALALGITGAILAVDPVSGSWQAVAAADDLPVATLAQRVAANVPGMEQIRRLPTGDVVAYSFDGNQARASRIDPADGHVRGAYEASALFRWVKNLHRSFLLGDPGRIAAAVIALAMLLLSVSGLTLTARRLGGWRRLTARVRGSLLQRIHVVTGRVAVAVLLLSSLTALYMSAVTFSLIPADADDEPDVASADSTQPDLRAKQLPLLLTLRSGDLRKLTFPAADDPEDVWHVETDQGMGWVDRRSGETLAWAPAATPQRLYDLVKLLHTGEGAWPWAVPLGLAGACIPLFWVTGLLMWWQARRQTPRIKDNAALTQADTLIFVASEGGTTWGFAEALHRALTRNGHRVHTSGLENFQTGAAARQIFVLAASYGDGQAPAHAAQALQRIASQPVGTASVTVLGFGDRQFNAFCGYAEALDHALRERGWQPLLPLEKIHQQSPQEFARWGEALAQALGEPLALDYVPRLPKTTALTLISRQHFPGAAGEPAVILRFQSTGLPRFDAGELIGIVPPGSPVPRYYSLACGWRDGFVEICVRKFPGGLCSGWLHTLEPGDTAPAFIKPNPEFVLGGTRKPAVLIGAGTGVAPLAGFIRRNQRRAPMHLYFGSRDPAKDFYFDREIQEWLKDHRLSSLKTAFSRVPDGGGYVQDALRGDTARVRELMTAGAIVRVCGSRAMSQGVAQTLDDILAPLHLSVARLKADGRYAEDIF